MMSKLNAGRYLALPPGGLVSIGLQDNRKGEALSLVPDAGKKAATSEPGPSKGSSGNETDVLDGFTLSPERVCTVEQSTSTYGWPFRRRKTSQVSYSDTGAQHR